MSRDSNRPRLGRGLSSLIRNSAQSPARGEYEPSSPEGPSEYAGQPDVAAQARSSADRAVIPVAHIEMNPYQPRRDFDEAALARLAESIRRYGLLQPVVVTELADGPGGRRYRLIAGERRLRAAVMAGVREIPCIVRRASRQEMLELALVENIHRADLNPIERAEGYRDLMDRFSLSQEQLAERLGQPRSTIANHLRLLELCSDVQALVRSGALSLGHAKVLAGLAGKEQVQRALARRVVREGLSVRALEQAVAGLEGRSAGEGEAAGPRRAAYILELERQISEALGTKVAVRPGRGKHVGRIVIHYYSLDDFDRIVEALGVEIDS